MASGILSAQRALGSTAGFAIMGSVLALTVAAVLPNKLEPLVASPSARDQIVDQVVDMLKTLTGEGEISVLLIEQNIGVAIDVADRVGVMVNGRIARFLSAAELGADVGLQHQLLGVRASDDEQVDEEPQPQRDDDRDASVVYTIRRAGDDARSGVLITSGTPGLPPGLAVRPGNQCPWLVSSVMPPLHFFGTDVRPVRNQFYPKERKPGSSSGSVCLLGHAV